MARGRRTPRRDRPDRARGLPCRRPAAALTTRHDYLDRRVRPSRYGGQAGRTGTTLHGRAVAIESLVCTHVHPRGGKQRVQQPAQDAAPAGVGAGASSGRSRVRPAATTRRVRAVRPAADSSAPAPPPGPGPAAPPPGEGAPADTPAAAL